MYLRSFMITVVSGWENNIRCCSSRVYDIEVYYEIKETRKTNERKLYVTMYLHSFKDFVKKS